MDTRLPTSGDLIDKAEAFWKSRCRGTSPPFRYDFSRLEENYFLLDRDARGGLRIRSSGLYLECLAGGTLAGRSIHSLIDRPGQNKLNAAVESVFNTPSNAFLDLSCSTGTFSLALFPVRADHGPIDFALGATNLDGIPDTVGGSFDLKHSRIVSLRENATELRYGFAEKRASFQSQHGGAALKLISGGGDAGAPLKQQFRVITRVKREP